MSISRWLVYFCLILLIACNPDTQTVTQVQEIIPEVPITVARKFSGNTLTVSASGVPPLAISLIRKDSVVYTDFLSDVGDLAINIGPMRTYFGKYKVVVEDATNRDTAMTIRIDQYRPGAHYPKSQSNNLNSQRSRVVTGEFVQLRSEVINHYTRTYIKCTECDIEATLFFPMKGTNWACDKFPDDLYIHQHVAGRETCKKLCESRK